jgi:hypothetical protein
MGSYKRNREWTRIDANEISRKGAEGRMNSRENAQKAQKKKEDEPRIDQPSREAMAGKLRIYADKTKIRIVATVGLASPFAKASEDKSEAALQGGDPYLRQFVSIRGCCFAFAALRSGDQFAGRLA